MSNGEDFIDPSREYKKALEDFHKGDVGKARGELLLAYKNTRDTDLKIKCSLEISKCLVNELIGGDPLTNTEVIRRIWEWLFDAFENCTTHYFVEEKRSAKARVKLNNYFKDISILCDYLSLAIDDLKKDSSF